MLRGLSIALLSTTLLFGACSKPDNQTSREEELRAGSGRWRQTAGTFSYRDVVTDKDTTANYYADSNNVCLTDNTLTFRLNRDGEYGFGDRRCNGTEPSTRPYFWQLLDADSTLEINFVGEAFAGEDPLRARFTAFSGSTFTIRYTAERPVPSNPAIVQPVVYTDVYTKQ